MWVLTTEGDKIGANIAILGDDIFVKITCPQEIGWRASGSLPNIVFLYINRLLSKILHSFIRIHVTIAREKLKMSACAWRGLYRATTAVIRGFGFGGLLPNTDLVNLYDKQGMDLF